MKISSVRTFPGVHSGLSSIKYALLALAIGLTPPLQAAVMVRGMSGGGRAAIGAHHGRFAINRFAHNRFAHNRFFDQRRMFAHRRFFNNNLAVFSSPGFAYSLGYPYGYGYGYGQSQQYLMAPLDYPDISSGIATGLPGDQYGSAVRGSVREVQLRLAEQGYYQGPIDGIIGPQTREALRGYQHDYNLAVTGTITSGVIGRLVPR